jgi:hypothetical protein
MCTSSHVVRLTVQRSAANGASTNFQIIRTTITSDTPLPTRMAFERLSIEFHHHERPRYRQLASQVAKLARHSGQHRSAERQSYQFEYNHQHGFLTKVISPSGAYIRYVYPADETSSANDYVIERRVSADGMSASEKVCSTCAVATMRAILPSSARKAAKCCTRFNAQGVEYELSGCRPPM